MRQNRLATIVAALTLAFTVASAGAQVRTLVPRLFKSGESTRAAFAGMVNEATESVVEILSDGEVSALGVVADADGFILTKASELRGKLECKLKDGKVYTATIVGIQNMHDIAMLKVDATGLKPVKWATNAKPEVGSWVATAGIGKQPVAVGVVSTPRRTIARQPGALGVQRKLLKRADGQEEAVKEARIGEVFPNSAAAEAGLEVDDVITHVDGKPVATFEHLANTIRAHGPGDVLTLRVKRGEGSFEVTVELSNQSVLPMDESRGHIQNRMGGKLSMRRFGFPQVIQHDTVLKPEQCGGPIVTLDGAVVGLNIARAGRVESYAVPADVIKAIIPDLKSGKLAPRNDIAKITPLTPDKTAPVVVSKDEKKDAAAQEPKEEKEEKDEKPSSEAPTE